MYRLGVVSFLNARPLIAGLDRDAGVEELHDVPARLPRLLDDGKVDAALIPIVDILRNRDRYRVLSDACIGCDGETMTVRVFSQAPPDRLKTLWVDGDSHTSIALANVLWRELYGRELELLRFDAHHRGLDEVESVLLIGDKVVDPARGSFAYEVDLGGAWRQHTGLPFVFAVWARLRDEATRRQRDEADVASAPRGGRDRSADFRDLASLLSQARDRGVERAAEIAAADGPKLGWPVEQARRYLTRCLKYKLDTRSIEGANLFGRLCAEADIVPSDSAIAWPTDLLTQEAV